MCALFTRFTWYLSMGVFDENYRSVSFSVLGLAIQVLDAHGLMASRARLAKELERRRSRPERRLRVGSELNRHVLDGR